MRPKRTLPAPPDPILRPLDAQELEQLLACAPLQTARRDQAKMRALARVAQGVPVKQAARSERIAKKTLNAAVEHYNEGGLLAVLPRRRGSQFALSVDQMTKIRGALLSGGPSFAAWSPLLLSLWIKERFGVSCRPDALRELAKTLTQGALELPQYLGRKRRHQKANPTAKRHETI